MFPDYSPSDPRGKTVLVVDDDEGILNLLDLIVRTAGFKVMTAPTGERAIELLGEKPAAVILDLIMPGCGGLGVLQHLRSAPKPVPPIILITAFQGKHPAVAEAIRDPNIFRCHSKPLDHEMLLGALYLCTQTQSIKSSKTKTPFQRGNTIPPILPGLDP